jgi:hypothetical protein
MRKQVKALEAVFHVAALLPQAREGIISWIVIKLVFRFAVLTRLK